METERMSTQRTVPVRLGSRAYEVRIGCDTLDGLGEQVRALIGGVRAFVVADTGLPQRQMDLVRVSLAGAGYEVALRTLTPSERRKSMSTLAELLEEIDETLHERTDPVIALGGGVVGDITGLAAAMYRRGVPVVQCPTTLLAMVDASVGGKTAVNLATHTRGPLRKNMAGAFHQPRLVHIDLRTLDSLPEREFRCGLAECVKHAMIGACAGDAELMPWLRARIDAVCARDPDTMIELVARNVAVKARIVEGDEHERDPHAGRALLNLGHTFAHALEPIADLSPTGRTEDAPLHHGEAVALGLICAASLGDEMGLLEAGELDTLRTMLERIGLPTSVDALPDDDTILDHMAHDKKVSGGRIRVVVPEAGARARVHSDIPREQIARAIGTIRRA